MDYFTSINEIDAGRALLLIDASIQAYNAFNSKQPAVCQTAKVTPPDGYELVDSWTGVDAIFGEDRTIECCGVVFRSLSAPFTYIFAFRGTASILDLLDDLGAEKRPFVPYKSTAPVGGAEVEAGFYDIYSETNNNQSMQAQLFSLIDKYNASEHPIGQLLITGHSLGSALSQLFTLDLALSRPDVKATNYNYACPRVGNAEFVTLYLQQPAQRNAETRTIRIQNTYDRVPCVPPELLGYSHTSPAVLVAFYKSTWDGIDLDFIVHDHSAVNYQAVLECAASSAGGVCLGKVEGDGYPLTSQQPKTSAICSLWA
jgi:triacylglycerol lipase